MAKVKLVLKAVGTATCGGTTLPVNANLTANFEIAGNTISVPTRGRVCVKGLRCASVHDFQSFDLPPRASNSWSLTADLQSLDGKRLQGNGSVDLSNGRSVPLNFAGLYNATADTFNSIQRETAPGKVVIHQASVAGSTMLIQKLKGKIMGQVLK